MPCPRPRRSGPPAGAPPAARNFACFLKREMYVTAFNVDESDRVRIEQDPEVTKAVDAMPKAQELLEKSKKLAHAFRDREQA